MLGVSDHTVADVRSELEIGAQIAHHDTRVGSDGVAQPARKHVATRHVPELANLDDVLNFAREVGSIKSKSFVENNTGNNEWYTPADIIEAARSVLGGFDLDPASSELANETVRANVIYTAADDGLFREWPIGRIFMNPPYAQPLMGQFATKYADAIRAGSTGIVLVNNATETAWFQEIVSVSAAVCLHKARIRFVAAKKASMAHGEWLPWLEANSDVLGFSTDRTASRLMKTAANRTLASVFDLSAPDAADLSRQMWGNAIIVERGEKEILSAARDIRSNRAKVSRELQPRRDCKGCL